MEVIVTFKKFLEISQSTYLFFLLGFHFLLYHINMDNVRKSFYRHVHVILRQAMGRRGGERGVVGSHAKNQSLFQFQLNDYT